MDSVTVRVRGVRELGRAFNKIDRELSRELRDRFKAIAEKVASHARGKVPKISGKAAGSIKARASASGAGIAFGGQKAEYYPWLDFGGRVGRNRSVMREMVPGGRYVYPAISEMSEEIERAAEDAVNDMARRAGFETRTGL